MLGRRGGGSYRSILERSNMPRWTSFQSRRSFMVLSFSSTRSWFDSHGFLEVQVPILTSAAVEGGATLFEVKYFEEKAYLTQSWQLYAEALIASVGRIYTVAPSFRAERSRTRRHLTEYWHVEAEAPWCDLDGIIRVEEQMLAYVLEHLVKTCGAELGLFERKLEDLQHVKPP